MPSVVLPRDRLEAAAVQFVDLPVDQSAILIGAAGTGKTTALLTRLTALVQGGIISTDQAVVVMPHRAAASAVRDQLIIDIGVSSDGPLVRSIASIAFEIVAEAHGRPVTLLTGSEHDQLIRDLLEGEIEDNADGYWPAQIGRDVRAVGAFRAELREALLRLTEHGIDPDQASDHAFFEAHADRHPEWRALARFASQVRRVGAEAYPDQRDSASLVTEAATIVASGGVGGLAGRLRVVFVDDVHESTESTLSLLRALHARGVAICATGNPDVASSGFRLGRTDSVALFSQRVAPGAERYALSHSHRMGRSIAQAYRQLTSAIGTSGVVEQRVFVDDEAAPAGRVVSLTAPTARQEVERIADVIRSLRLGDDQIDYREMVVVTRSATAARQVEGMLARAGVVTVRNAARLLLAKEPGSRWLVQLAWLCYQSDPFGPDSSVENIPEHIRTVLESPLGGLDPLALRRLRRQLRSRALTEYPAGEFDPRFSGEALLRAAMRTPSEFDQLGTPEGQRAFEAARAVAELSRRVNDLSVEELIYELWLRSNTEDALIRASAGTGVMADEAHRALDAVVSLQAAARRFTERRPDESGEVFLAELRGADIADDALVPDRVDDAVLVTTPSALIGRNYRVVILAGLQRGRWPNLRPRHQLLGIDRLLAWRAGDTGPVDPSSMRDELRSDEYRLAALAVSRARDLVVLSAVQSDDDTPSPLLVLGQPVAGDSEAPELALRLPGARSYVARLRRRLVQSVQVGNPDEAAATALARLAGEGYHGAHPDDWYGLVERSTQDPVLGQDPRVSPSSVEKLESSPLRWFIDTYAPEPSDPSRSVGTLVHLALERVNEDNPSAAAMLATVQERWDAISFDAAWVKNGRYRSVERMVARVAEYLEAARADGREKVAAEARFELDIEGVSVTGSIDRIERTRDGSFFVIDLKTGKTAPKASEIPEHAQLLIYQLAIAEGAVPGLVGTVPAGAAIVSIGARLGGAELLRQQPLDAEMAERVRALILRSAALMRGPSYSAASPAEEDRLDRARRYRMHTIPAVSE